MWNWNEERLSYQFSERHCRIYHGYLSKNWMGLVIADAMEKRHNRFRTIVPISTDNIFSRMLISQSVPRQKGSRGTLHQIFYLLTMIYCVPAYFTLPSVIRFAFIFLACAKKKSFSFNFAFLPFYNSIHPGATQYKSRDYFRDFETAVFRLYTMSMPTPKFGLLSSAGRCRADL